MSNGNGLCSKHPADPGLRLDVQASGDANNESRELETIMDAALAQMAKRNLEQEERITERVTELVKSAVRMYDKMVQQKFAEMEDANVMLKESLVQARKDNVDVLGKNWAARKSDGSKKRWLLLRSWPMILH